MNIDGLSQLTNQSQGITLGSVSTSTTTVTTTVTTTSDTEDTVNISADALRALASDSGATLHNNTPAKKAQDAQATEDDESEDPVAKIEQQIEKLQQQLEELQQELQALQGDDSKQADTKRRQLQAEMGMVNAQITVLTNQKAKLESEQDDSGSQSA